MLVQFEGLPTKDDSENYMDERRQQLVGEIEELREYYRSQNERGMVCIHTHMYASEGLTREHTFL